MTSSYGSGEGVVVGPRSAGSEVAAPLSASTGKAIDRRASSVRAQIDLDGDDDPGEITDGPPPASLRFERVGRPPLALQRICDLTAFGDGLYAAHANQPLGTDGATISVYRPDDDKHPFRVAFDWNRAGEPTKGGGAGQGFLRVHLIDHRLFVPDADPPYAGFGFADHGAEGYVFVSDASGEFARARMPGHLPPSTPVVSADDGDAGGVERAGAGVIARAYHVIDVIRFRGRYYASTGSVPPTERAWRGASPGALHVADPPWARWLYAIDYPFPWKPGVWRLTYLVRYRDRLYAGISDYDRQEPNDYLVFAPPPETSSLSRETEHAVRATRDGGAMTLRWYADDGQLFWIALERDGAVALRVTRDGDNWNDVPLPAEAGRPTDIVRFRGMRVALTERGLWRIDATPPTLIARVGDPSPFAITDAFCVAPLAVFRGVLYAGSQRDGSLWRLSP